MSPGTLAEGGGLQKLTLIFTLTGGEPPEFDATVTLAYFGTASFNDYNAPISNGTIKVGQRSGSAVIGVTPFQDDEQEANEVIRLRATAEILIFKDQADETTVRVTSNTVGVSIADPAVAPTPTPRPSSGGGGSQPTPTPTPTPMPTPAPVPRTLTPVDEAMAMLGENFVRAFYFNNDTKDWTFCDPRAGDANTIEAFISGESYWILVKESRATIINGKVHILICMEGNCWNQIGW